ncbi:MAG: 3-deoxy-8-phosphooctulonate synthase [Candidatus Omnitrophica bacterium]|nr:3-deoxy-8-phosphooctulonate synthase [Candidatus Omnitrophota bacterium]
MKNQNPPPQTLRRVRVDSLEIGEGRPFVLIGGPCVIENEKSAIRHAKAVKRIADHLKIPYLYKSSYDKANRSSPASFRGLGIDKGLLVLQHVKDETGLAVLTDVHSPEEAEKAAGVVDVLQIPAFLCRQTDLLMAAGRTGRVVNVKKGQFMAPWDMAQVVSKIAGTGNRQVLLTERGTSFGYNTLVNDFRSIPIMKRLGCPVIFDATHSVQQPGARGTSSGGEREFAPVLAQAAIAAGADGIFMEIHENPDEAPSDGPNMIPLKSLKRLLERLLKLSHAVR